MHLTHLPNSGNKISDNIIATAKFVVPSLGCLSCGSARNTWQRCMNLAATSIDLAATSTTLSCDFHQFSCRFKWHPQNSPNTLRYFLVKNIAVHVGILNMDKFWRHVGPLKISGISKMLGKRGLTFWQPEFWEIWVDFRNNWGSFDVFEKHRINFGKPWGHSEVYKNVRGIRLIISIKIWKLEFGSFWQMAGINH